MDEIGHVVWEADFEADADAVADLRVDAGGECMVLGSASGDVWLAKVNVAGEVSWRREIGSVRGDDRGVGLAAYADGVTVVAASHGRPVDGGFADAPEWWLFAVGDDGAVLWEAPWTQGGVVETVAVEASGSILVAGTTERGAWKVIRTDALGNPLWEREEELVGFPTRIVPSPLGGFVLAGHVWGEERGYDAALWRPVVSGACP